jgi:hypothetical protein
MGEGNVNMRSGSIACIRALYAANLAVFPFARGTNLKLSSNGLSGMVSEGHRTMQSKVTL